MGLDGLMKPKRVEMIEEKNTARSNAISAEIQRARDYNNSFWTEDPLSGMELAVPIYATKKGLLFNKMSLLEAIANNTLPKTYSRLKKKKNLKEIDLLGAPNLLKYTCPITSKSPSPNTVEIWVVIWKCGHIFNRVGLERLKLTNCPICGVEFTKDDLIVLSSTEQTKHYLQQHPIK